MPTLPIRPLHTNNDILLITYCTDIDVRSRVWKRKYYHDLQHREEHFGTQTVNHIG